MASTSLLEPEELIERLHALWEQIGEFSPLTPQQRRELTPRKRVPEQQLITSLNVIGMENVSRALGYSLAEVQQMIEDATRWKAAEQELLATWHGVHGANLLRRRRIELLAEQAARIAAQLARDPAHAGLVPHVEEIKRLRSFTRRKKAAPAPETEPTETP